MSDHPDLETLAHFGCEGTGVTVLGRRRPDGTWELQLASDSMTVDANDHEAWISTTRPIASLPDAFEECRDCFGAIVPVGSVHGDFRAEMLAVIEQLAPHPEQPIHELWIDRNRQRWLSASGQPLPGTSGDSSAKTHDDAGRVVSPALPDCGLQPRRTWDRPIWLSTCAGIEWCGSARGSCEHVLDGQHDRGLALFGAGWRESLGTVDLGGPEDPR